MATTRIRRKNKKAVAKKRAPVKAKPRKTRVSEDKANRMLGRNMPRIGGPSKRHPCRYLITDLEKAQKLADKRGTSINQILREGLSAFLGDKCLF